MRTRSTSSANLYYNGEGVPRQQFEALRLWRQAATQGHVESEFSLAEAYLSATAVPVDLAEAEKWMRKAARHGHPDAVEPASMLARGLVPQPEMVERRSGGLPSQVRDVDERSEPAAPKFKAPPAVTRELALATPELAKGKVRNAKQYSGARSSAAKQVTKTAAAKDRAARVAVKDGAKATVVARPKGSAAKVARAAPPAKPSMAARASATVKQSAATRVAAVTPTKASRRRPGREVRRSRSLQTRCHRGCHEQVAQASSKKPR